MIGPVERICRCPVPVTVPGNENHTPECNRMHAATFFAAVRQLQLSWHLPLPPGAPHKFH